MNISALQTVTMPTTQDINPERLAGNSSLTEKQKIAEASRQFEAMLLRQIFSEAQKPVITSEFTDNSTSAGIYQDFIVNQLSNSLSKAGKLGFAQIFERQLTRPEASPADAAGQPATQISPTHQHE
jgi:Rod binding domain-containing protein